MIKILQKYYLAILWSLLSLVACGVNGNSLPHVTLDIGIDKIAHFILFGVQSFLIIHAHHKNRIGVDWNNVHQAVFVGISYGIFIEFLQYAVFVNRSFDYADMLADGVGATSCYIWALVKDRL